MLHTIVPMDQIFPPERPGGRTAKTEGNGSFDGCSGNSGGVGLTAEAALGGAMSRLDYHAATKAFPC